MLNCVGSGTAGNPPAGAAGSTLTGIVVMFVKRGAWAIFTEPTGFEMLLDNP